MEMASAKNAVLCFHHQDAQLCICSAMQRLLSDIDFSLTGTASTAATRPRLAEQCKQKFFHELHYAAVGCKVMLVQNLDIDQGAVNGATATVLRLHTHRNELDNCWCVLITVELTLPSYALSSRSMVLNTSSSSSAPFPWPLPTPPQYTKLKVPPSQEVPSLTLNKILARSHWWMCHHHDSVRDCNDTAGATETNTLPCLPFAFPNFPLLPNIYKSTLVMHDGANSYST